MSKNSDEKLPETASILIVDDNPRNLQLMSTVLKERGYKLFVTNSGENALVFLEQTVPDLILLDIMMPGMSGFEVCRRIKSNERLKAVPVIFLTAKNEVEDVVEGFEAGAVDYVTKPFNTREVFVRISTHLQLQQARRTLVTQNRELEKLNTSLQDSKAIIEEDKKRLEQLNTEKNRFFSIIAHDLRSPISGLLGLSEIIRTQAGNISQEELKEFAGLLYDASSEVYNLLENLLDWSRLQMNVLSYSPEKLQLKPVLIDAVKVIRQEWEKKNLQLSIDCSNELEMVADLNMIKTVIRNLASNAVKFTPSGGKISIVAEASSKENIVISVTDNGIGISEEMQQDIFSLTLKASRQGTNGEKSTGLGLLICKDFIERHGGILSVESKEDRGSTFTITLPSN